MDAQCSLLFIREDAREHGGDIRDSSLDSGSLRHQHALLLFCGKGYIEVRSIDSVDTDYFSDHAGAAPSRSHILGIHWFVRSRALFGPGFYVVHLALFFLCAPALANLLVLRHRERWYFVPFACAGLALFLVLLQYGVSESLYGINGDDGPYSGAPNTPGSSTDHGP